jgi:hypothetical protein
MASTMSGAVWAGTDKSSFGMEASSSCWSWSSGKETYEPETGSLAWISGCSLPIKVWWPVNIGGLPLFFIGPVSDAAAVVSFSKVLETFGCRPDLVFFEAAISQALFWHHLVKWMMISHKTKKKKNHPSINERYDTILHGIDATTVQ